MTSSEQWSGRHWPVPTQPTNALWGQMRAAGGRRFERLVVWRHLWAAGLAAAMAAVAIVLVVRTAAGAGGSPLLAVVLSGVVLLLVIDAELRCRRSYLMARAAAARFVDLYRLGEQRELSMDEENELWALASRRLRLCPLTTMFGFEHGTKPADDAFLASAYWYLVGGRPQLVPVRVEVGASAGRRAS